MRHKYRYLSTGSSLEYWRHAAKVIDLKKLFDHDAPYTIKQAKERQVVMNEVGCNILQLDSNFNPIRII